MQSHKIKSYIGFAVKAGDVVFGLDNILTSRGVKVIVKDNTLQEASLRKLNNYLAKHDVPLVTLEDMLLGKDILKRDNTKIIGISNTNLAKAIVAEAGLIK